MKKKYLDTYALIEVANGNPHFSVYLFEDFVITDITLAEFYAVLLREDGQKTADYWLKKLSPYSVNVTKHILIEAIKFRHQYKKKRISFFDSVGYIYAIENGCVFVTGDKEFENFKNVEFRK